MANRYTVTIETRGAAFDDAPEFEVARILRAMADRLESSGILPAPRDTNGNVCGSSRFETLND